MTATILRQPMSCAIEIRLPTLASASDGVERDEQLAHACDEGDLQL
ncbi:hypothetical protein KPA98_26185 [Burkholderia cenocepacia]|nr:hypothetical protein [Burkholderia cenocepacia]MDV3100934.1 hypothetical protein [Burkholderia cenocepacia]